MNISYGYGKINDDYDNYIELNCWDRKLKISETELKDQDNPMNYIVNKMIELEHNAWPNNYKSPLDK